MDEATQRKIHGVTQEYRENLRAIADDMESDPQAKQQKARDAHRVALDMQQDITSKWSASLDNRAAELEKKLYHGDKAYTEAVRSLSGKNHHELEEAARLASRTGDETMARAAAVVGREKGSHQIFYDYASGNDEFSEAFTELAQIPDLGERQAMIRNVAAPAPQSHDLTPSNEARQAHRRAHTRTAADNVAPGSILGPQL